MSIEIRDYVYVDKERLQQFLEQGAAFQRLNRSEARKVVVSLAGPRYESTTNHVPVEMTTHERVEALIEHLRDNDYLDSHRPIGMADAGGTGARPFAMEMSVVAQKIILPRKSLRAVPSLRELAVWVSEPDPDEVLASQGFEFRGTFLFLVEGYWDDTEYHTVYSGCSALQAISNAIVGEPFLMGAGGEPLGRGSSEHPVEKLKGLGGVVADRRTIDCLYRKRYVTNEQSYTHEGAPYRVHDVLAYPIFIAAL